MQILNNVDIKYKDNTILENVNIYNDTIIHLIGPNGCGKSSLCKAIVGDINYEGVINIDKHNVAYISDKVVLPPELTIKEIVSIFNLEINNEFYEYLEQEQLVNKKIGSFSSGQNKVAEIYLAISSGFNTIIFDEVTNNLDINNKDMVLKMIKNLKKTNISVIYISHDLGELIELPGSYYFYDQVQKTFVKKDTGKKDILEIYREMYV